MRIGIALAVALFSTVAAAQPNSPIGPSGTGTPPLTVGTTPVGGGSNGNCLYINSTLLGAQSCGISGLVVGTTTISGGTTTRVLYDNAGVIGEYTNTQLTALINAASATLSGALPAWPNTTTTFFRGDGTYTALNLAAFPTQATNTVLGNGTSGTAVPTALAVGSCSTASSALIWTTNTGFGCNTSITASSIAVGGITGLGTGVATALAVNVGSAGAFVTFNGALGTPSSGTLTNATGLPLSTGVTGTLQAAQTPAYTGDVTKSAGSLTTVLANIPTAVPMAGSILSTNIAAPGTPASGKTSLFVDSTAKRFHDINDAGTIGTTVVADTGATNNFLTAISAAGVISKAQPSFTNLSGSVAAAQMPALTGDVTTSAGAVATTIAANAVTLAKLATQATNTVLGNATSGSAVPTALAVGTCSTAGSALNWTTNTGFGCNTSITAAAVPASGLTGTTLASNVVTASLTTVGTIASGVWSASISGATTGATINAGSAQFPTNLSLIESTHASSRRAALGVGSSWQVMQDTNGNGTKDFCLYGGTSPTCQLTISTAGAIGIPSIASSSAAQTGTVCWTTSTGNLTVDTTTTCLLSSARFKHDIRPLDARDSLATVMALRPVSYQYNDPAIAGQQVGFIAEDVAQLDDRLVSREPDGSPRAVRYQQLTADLAGAIQAQQKQIEELRARRWCLAGWCW